MSDAVDLPLIGASALRARAAARVLRTLPTDIKDAAIARLGAKQDGVLRNHQRMPDGSLRDTVVFSIIASEWPTVRQHLQFQLERPRAESPRSEASC